MCLFVAFARRCSRRFRIRPRGGRLGRMLGGRVRGGAVLRIELVFIHDRQTVIRPSDYRTDWHGRRGEDGSASRRPDDIASNAARERREGRTPSGTRRDALIAIYCKSLLTAGKAAARPLRTIRVSRQGMGIAQRSDPAAVGRPDGPHGAISFCCPSDPEIEKATTNSPRPMDPAAPVLIRASPNFSSPQHQDPSPSPTSP